MSNDTDRTPEDDLIYEHLAELVKLIERTGQKVKGLHIEFESNVSDSAELSTRTFWPSGITTEQVAAKSKVLIKAGSETPFEAAPVFVLRPVDDNDPLTDKFLKWLQEHRLPH